MARIFAILVLTIVQGVLTLMLLTTAIKKKTSQR